MRLKARKCPSLVLSGSDLTAAFHPTLFRTWGILPYDYVKVTRADFEEFNNAEYQNRDFDNEPFLALRAIPDLEVSPEQSLLKDWCFKALGIEPNGSVKVEPAQKSSKSGHNIRFEDNIASIKARKPLQPRISSVQHAVEGSFTESNASIILEPFCSSTFKFESTNGQILRNTEHLFSDLASVFSRTYDKLCVYHRSVIPICHFQSKVLVQVTIVNDHQTYDQKEDTKIAVASNTTVLVRLKSEGSAKIPPDYSFKKNDVILTGDAFCYNLRSDLGFQNEILPNIRSFLTEAFLLESTRVSNMLPEELPGLNLIDFSRPASQWSTAQISDRMNNAVPGKKLHLSMSILHGDVKEIELITKSFELSSLGHPSLCHSPITLDCMELLASEALPSQEAPLQAILALLFAPGTLVQVATGQESVQSIEDQVLRVRSLTRVIIFESWMSRILSMYDEQHNVLVFLNNVDTYMKYSAPGVSLEDIEESSSQYDDGMTGTNQQIVKDPFKSAGSQDLYAFLSVLPLIVEAYRRRIEKFKLVRASVAVAIICDDKRCLPKQFIQTAQDTAQAGLRNSTFEFMSFDEFKPRERVTLEEPVTRYIFPISTPCADKRAHILYWGLCKEAGSGNVHIIDMEAYKSLNYHERSQTSARHIVLHCESEDEVGSNTDIIDSLERKRPLPILLSAIAELTAGWSRSELRVLARNIISFAHTLEDEKCRSKGSIIVNIESASLAMSLQSPSVAQLLKSRKESHPSSCAVDSLSTKLLGGFGTSALWSSICGYQTERERAMTIVSQWIRPDRLSALGQASSGGLLLTGPSGCGKSLFAKAIVSLGGLNHLYLSCSNIFQKYLGESERVIRETFRQASSRTPCVVLIDEIDVVAPSRGHGERNDTGTGVEARVLSTLLNLLDGIERRRGVYVVATAREARHIDSALLRPGRLDEHITIGYPDLGSIRAMLNKMFPLPNDRYASKTIRIVVKKNIPPVEIRDPSEIKIEADSFSVREHDDVLSRVASMLVVSSSELKDGVQPLTGSEVMSICREAIMLSAQHLANSSSLLMNGEANAALDWGEIRELVVTEGHLMIAAQRVLARGMN